MKKRRIKMYGKEADNRVFREKEKNNDAWKR